MRAGIHLPNDGRMSHDDLQLLAGLQIVKGLVRLDVQWDRLDWRRIAEHLDPGCVVVLRLYTPGRLRPGDFVDRSARELPPVLARLKDHEVLIQIHNEPNHCTGHEGWGPTEAHALDFREWYRRVYAGLQEHGFGGLGFPGLAVGNHAHGERRWSKVCRKEIRRSDWVGCHCYWQRPEELEHPALGANWTHYRVTYPNKRLIVVESGNSSCHSPELPQMTPDRQRAEYLQWCRSAASGGVDGVTFYMLAGSSEWAGFRLYPSTVRALGSWRDAPA